MDEIYNYYNFILGIRIRKVKILEIDNIFEYIVGIALLSKNRDLYISQLEKLEDKYTYELNAIVEEIQNSKNNCNEKLILDMKVSKLDKRNKTLIERNDKLNARMM